MLTLHNRTRGRGPAQVNAWRYGMRLALAGAASCLFAACAQQPKTLYTWETYQPTVYAYLKEPDSDAAAQAQDMERNIETARATHRALPPGFHGHLGMLYLRLGQEAKAIEQMEEEKLAFPESEPFMDFLMRNLKPTSHLSSAPVAGAVAATAARALPESSQPQGGV